MRERSDAAADGITSARAGDTSGEINATRTRPVLPDLRFTSRTIADSNSGSPLYSPTPDLFGAVIRFSLSLSLSRALEHRLSIPVYDEQEQQAAEEGQGHERVDVRRE